MKDAIKFAFWFGVGYFVVTKAAPYIQARAEAADLDTMWDVYSDVWGDDD